MKRYRVLDVDFDTRAVLLETEIQATWDPRIQRQWQDNKRRVREGIIHEFGADQYERKLTDFVAMGAGPMSVLAFHNRFYREVRFALAMGAYYPALLGASALGERILNHLIIAVRQDFKHTPQYPRSIKKRSFDDWDWMIRTLVSWGVLLDGAALAFRQLKAQRHAAVHFRPELDQDPRPAALEAVRLLSTIIEAQFSAFGSQPWFIPDTPGASYIRREATAEPFVKRVLVPHAVLVGPRHQLHATLDGWRVEDETYPNVEVTDDAFAAMSRGEA